MISEEKAAFISSLADDKGYIDPQRVIDEARNPKTPIHEDFDWDVNVAAQKCWMDQATTLIRFVRLNLVIEHRSVIAPHYVVDPDRPPKSRRYVDLSLAARNRATSWQILFSELDRIAAATRRAQQIADVVGLRAELDEFLDDVSLLRTAAERKKDEKTKPPPTRGGKPVRGKVPARHREART
jgi:hypothetical protein